MVLWGKTMDLNAQAESLCRSALADPDELRIAAHQTSSGATVIDFGVEVVGGLEAGRMLAEICTGGAAEVTLLPPQRELGPWPMVQVRSDEPVAAFMGAQYAGWPIQHGKFYAMGSGPMRQRRGEEAVLDRCGLVQAGDRAVGVLECDRLPEDAICVAIAEACKVPVERLTLCVAPTRSIAGCVQVVARSVETCLHKMFELGVDLSIVRSGMGVAPLPPVRTDFAEGIGVTNDAILYGGQVALWVDAEDGQVQPHVEAIPSRSSRDWGKPFAEVFRGYKYDFYLVDKGLFSPAEVMISNLRSGRCWRSGELRPDMIHQSFLGTS